MAEARVLVRTSERTKFKDCRQAWQWAYVDHLKPKQEKSAFAFGTDTHKVLELRYKPGKKRGPPPAKIAKKLWVERERQGERPYTVKIGDEQVPADELLVHMMENYYEEYGDDERYEVIASEMTFNVDVHHPKTGKYLFTYVGTIDGLWYDTWEDVFVFAEHKTGAGLEPFGAPIYLDEQQASYWAYGPIFLEERGLLKPGQVIDHVLYNRLRKGFRDERPRNDQGQYLNQPKKDALLELALDQLEEVPKKATMDVLKSLLEDEGIDWTQVGEVSKNQGTPLFRREKVLRSQKEREIIQRRVIHEAREMSLVRQGKLKVYKRPDKHCGYCEFRDMCEVHETGDDWQALRDNMFRVWDPYKDHQEDSDDE